ncbi:MAG TPA: hypothetical protein DGX96_01410 [Lachnospiraceae bacterium]|jgi:hypothetical protein|nr:hypothetical protein [Lachnospiraceae bacterium]
MSDTAIPKNKLKDEDVHFFYQVFLPLLAYVGDVTGQAPDLRGKSPVASKWDTSECYQCASILFRGAKGPKSKKSGGVLIDDYLASRSDVSERERKLLLSWRDHAVGGLFIIERYLKDGAIIIGGDNQVYLVRGLTDSIEDTMMFCGLPFAFRGTLLPFEGVVIYDGLCSVLPVSMGGGIKGNLKAQYLKAKADNAIISCLEPDRAPKETPAPAKKPKQTAAKVPAHEYTLRVYPKGQSRTLSRVLAVSSEHTVGELVRGICSAFRQPAPESYTLARKRAGYDNDLYYTTDLSWGNDRPVTTTLAKMRLAEGETMELTYGESGIRICIHVKSVRDGTAPGIMSVIESKGTW